MRIKILNTQKEKEINKELESLEKERNIDNIIPFKSQTWILHFSLDKEFEKHFGELKKDYEELNKERKIQDWFKWKYYHK